MSDRSRFVLLLLLAVASVALLLVVRHQAGSDFIRQF